jgi:hypothetical protein
MNMNLRQLAVACGNKKQFLQFENVLRRKKK